MKFIAGRFLFLAAVAYLAACTPEETEITGSELAATVEEPTGPVINEFIANDSDVTIAGDIYQRNEDKPKTILLIVGGSGVGPRTDVAPFAPIIIDDGIAVAIFDRRGTGLSSGDYTIPDTLNSEWLVPLLASDVEIAVTHLKSLGFERVGLLGSSFGSWVNVAAAAKSEEVDFMINFSGGGSSVGVSDYFDALTDEGASIAEATEAARTYEGPQGYDPSLDLLKINQPGLWIFGDMDDSNPTILDAENVQALEQNKDFRVVILSNVNHDFIDVETGEMTMAWLEIVQNFARSQQ